MKPRKLNIKTVPCQNIPRAKRFWREVFNFLEVTNNGQREFIIDKQAIEFVESDQPQEFELIVRDHHKDAKAHLINYFVEILDEKTTDKNVIYTIKDSEENTINVVCNI